MKPALPAIVLIIAMGVQTGAQDRARQVIFDAAEALGGRDRVLAVRNITIEGFGSNPNLGQQMRPESELLLWMVPDFVRTIDLEHDRMLLSFTRRPAFPAVFDNQRTRQGLDGDVAYNVPLGFGGRGAPAPPPAPVRASDAVARERRVEMLHYPLTAVRAGLAPTSTVSNLKVTAAGRSVDITTMRGETITLAVDDQSRPVSVSSAVYHTNLGDVVRTTTFGGYEDARGVRLPKRFVVTLDRWTEWDIGVTKNTVDGDIGDLAQPSPARTAPAPSANPPQNVIVNEVAKGIWFLTGAGVPSMVVEFADHVAIVEVPGNDARTLAVIAKARELVPGKPVTQAIVTHHHFDHSGGLRAAVAEGLTIVTHRLNEPWFREMVRRKHSIAVDALARSPRPLKIVPVDDMLTMKDGAMEMNLYHLAGSTHGDAMLAIYFPAQRVYAEPDVWNPGAQIQPHVRSLYADITRRKLAIDRIVPLHGTMVQPYGEFLKIVTEWTGIPTSATN
jgi:glyoxylase-like metal-dependent hydrolase (beta-lactamase superfamily II)